MAKKKKRIPLDQPQDTGFGSTFGDLLKQHRPELQDQPTPDNSAAEQPASQPQATTTPEKLDAKALKKATLRRERKGRGGKTVTLIEGLRATDSQLQQLAKDLRKALGCGSVVEGTTIVLQGDIQDRVQQWIDSNC